MSEQDRDSDESPVDPSELEPVEVPITPEIDLHTFRPNDIGVLLPEYFHECRKKGILNPRVIHGKGTGALREGVHRLLETLPEVISFRLGDETTGSWGATLVWLKPWKDESHHGEGDSNANPS